MIKKIKKNQLIKFEEEIANLFNNAKIRAPVHLYYGNERSIIEVFKRIKKKDWVFCSWRSHYQCLLKGVPEKLIKKDIMKGKSISLCFPKYKIYSSAIVGGILPIALGVAFAAKLKRSNEKVYCFIGDMTSETGMMNECYKFAVNHKLPIHFIIEDNNISVCTDTRKTWKMKKLSYEKIKSKYITFYKYKNKYPHAGAGTRVQF
ncbi:thiamine pyrophosphate-dependent enzyme [Candidatus Pelagibacter sp.]|nr:thiamine pyrophosphate-dependent enzyme [Candidatus Pelagibacter sp.]